MNINKTALSVALVAVMGSSSFAAQAAIVTATTASFASGGFGMNFLTGGGYVPFTSIGSGSTQLIGVASGETWDVNTAQFSAQAGAIGSFAFGSTANGAHVYVNAFTAAADSQGVDAGGHALPSATWDTVTGIGTMDMGSFYFNWNGTNFSQGNTTAAMTVATGCTSDCTYSVSWQSLIVDGPFDGQTGSWKFTGTISGTTPPAVPVPAAAWLMGSGLVGLVGVARRRRNKV